MIELVYLFIGLAVGALLGWLLKGSRAKNETKWVSIDLFYSLQSDVKKKDKEINALSASLAKSEQWASDLQEKLSVQKEEVEKLQSQFKNEFQNISNAILEDKSRRFLAMNEQKVGEILKPLKERIMEFEKRVDHQSQQNLRWNSALQEQIKHLKDSSHQLAADAQKLTTALRGDKKTQGSWGEVQLERVLEKAGLQKDLHYRKEAQLKQENGQNFRPDYIILLPEEKHLIIDSKVSLNAYEKYFNADEETDAQAYLATHIKNLEKHIKDLSAKNYEQLHGINSPDYVMLFVPIEPALLIALKQKPDLFDQALQKNIVLVSTSTLLATLRTIAFLWKQENQKKNAQLIAKESGALYDKFHGFIKDLEQIGKRIKDLQDSHESAVKKLYKSPQQATTILGRINRLKELGADTKKQIDLHE